MESELDIQVAKAQSVLPPWWREVSPEHVWPSNRKAAEHARAAVVKDLGIDMVALRFFEPAVQGASCNSCDAALDLLNAPPYDPTMTGRIVGPDVVKGPIVIWVRAGLTAGGIAFVVAHECRRLWLHVQGREWGEDAAEDAELYAVQEAPLEEDLKTAVWHWFREGLD